MQKQALEELLHYKKKERDVSIWSTNLFAFFKWDEWSLLGEVIWIICITALHLKSEKKNTGIDRGLKPRFVIVHTFACNVSSVGTPTVNSRKKQAKLYTSVGLPWGFLSKT